MLSQKTLGNKTQSLWHVESFISSVLLGGRVTLEIYLDWHLSGPKHLISNVNYHAVTTLLVLDIVCILETSFKQRFHYTLDPVEYWGGRGGLPINNSMKHCHYFSRNTLDE